MISYLTPNSPMMQVAEDVARIKNIWCEFEGKLSIYGHVNYELRQKEDHSEIWLRQRSTWPQCGFIMVEV